MKVPPKRKGNADDVDEKNWLYNPSMKVPPKRKGNLTGLQFEARSLNALNESPSEKEGKLCETANSPMGEIAPQ